MFDAMESFLGSLSPITDDIASGQRLATALCLDIPLGAPQFTQAAIETVRSTLERHDGKIVDQGPRKLTAVFAGSIRAMRCALTIAGELDAVGIEGRIGMHSGSVGMEQTTTDAVWIAIQLASMAAPGSIIASQDVKNISPVSGFELEPLGEQEIVGMEAPLDLYLLIDPSAGATSGT